jgi:hypothetical protein
MADLLHVHCLASEALRTSEQCIRIQFVRHSEYTESLSGATDAVRTTWNTNLLCVTLLSSLKLKRAVRRVTTVL